MKIGIQVSSLKPLLTTEEQVREAFQKMKALGCDTVQLQWIDTRVPPHSVAGILKETGICSVGVQDFYTEVRKHFDYYASLNALTGGTWLCVSRIPEHLKSQAGLQIFLQELRQLQQELNSIGQKLCFHPVSGDYTAVPGVDIVEYLLRNLPGLGICLDLYHLNRNCDDMPEFIHRCRDDICMVHFKDSLNGVLVPAGQGDTDWSGVVRACLFTGIPYAFAEQESWERDPYDCLKEAMDWISTEIQRI